jgi:hypothetical protein
MSHAAFPEEVHHHRPQRHHPNHRHAVPPRPILHRRATTSHLARQAPARTQCAHHLPCQHCQLLTSLLSPCSVIDAEEFRCFKA